MAAMAVSISADAGVATAPLIITSTVVAFIATLEISSVLENRRGAVPQAGASR
jgi:hypothetical protein